MTLDSFSVSHLILIEPYWPFDLFVRGLYRESVGDAVGGYAFSPRSGCLLGRT
jgi:hypothetical protein